MKKKSIGVLGSGSWATALVKILSENTSNINWYIRNSDILEQIRTDKSNGKWNKNKRSIGKILSYRYRYSRRLSGFKKNFGI